MAKKTFLEIRDEVVEAIKDMYFVDSVKEDGTIVFSLTQSEDNRLQSVFATVMPEEIQYKYENQDEDEDEENN